MKKNNNTIIYSLQKDEWDNVYNYLIEQYGINKLKKDLYQLSEYEYIDEEQIIEKYKQQGYEEEAIKWILKQVTDFSLGILRIDNIGKLKTIGLFSNEKRFNEEDLETINKCFYNIKDTIIYRNDIKSNIWILKLVKYFVINYYHRRKNQTYNMEEYINMITLHILESMKYNNPKERDIYRCINYHKRSIINYIKNINKKEEETLYTIYEDNEYDLNEFTDYLSESQELISYFNMLTDRQKMLLMNYYGFRVENGKLKQAPNFTLEELSEILKASYQRVQQILKLTLEEIINYKNQIEEQKSLENIDIYKDLTEGQTAIIQALDSKDKLKGVKLFKEGYYDKDIIKAIKHINLNTTDERIISDILELNDFIEELEHQKEKESNIKFMFR